MNVNVEESDQTMGDQSIVSDPAPHQPVYGRARRPPDAANLPPEQDLVPNFNQSYASLPVIATPKKIKFGRGNPTATLPPHLSSKAELDCFIETGEEIYGFFRSDDHEDMAIYGQIYFLPLSSTLGGTGKQNSLEWQPLDHAELRIATRTFQIHPENVTFCFTKGRPNELVVIPSVGTEVMIYKSNTMYTQSLTGGIRDVRDSARVNGKLYVVGTSSEYDSSHTVHGFMDFNKYQFEPLRSEYRFTDKLYVGNVGDDTYALDMGMLYKFELSVGDWVAKYRIHPSDCYNMAAFTEHNLMIFVQQDPPVSLGYTGPVVPFCVFHPGKNGEEDRIDIVKSNVILHMPEESSWFSISVKHGRYYNFLIATERGKENLWRHDLYQMDEAHIQLAKNVWAPASWSVDAPDADVYLQVGDTRLPAHKFVLCRYDYFQSSLKSFGGTECQSNILNISDSYPQIVSEILQYIYTGVVSSDLSMEVLRDILILGHSWCLTDLEFHIARQLSSRVRAHYKSDHKGKKIAGIGGCTPEEWASVISIAHMTKSDNLFRDCLEWFLFQQNAEVVETDKLNQALCLLATKSPEVFGHVMTNYMSCSKIKEDKVNFLVSKGFND